MTQDYRIYLRPGDLITAEDVLAWQRRPMLDRLAEVRSSGVRIPHGLVSEADLLAARIDRERRQACRRGALEAWRVFRSWVHGWGYDPMQEGGEEAAECLADALAFRAAARAK